MFCNNLHLEIVAFYMAHDVSLFLLLLFFLSFLVCEIMKNEMLTVVLRLYCVQITTIFFRLNYNILEFICC